MKRYGPISIIFIIGCSLLLDVGCNKQAEEPVALEPAVTVHEAPNSPAEGNTVVEEAQKKPRIKFDKLTHDFGEVGPGSTHRCEFRFTNVGQGTLKVTKPGSSCSCTVGQLTKTEYAPGESGVIKVTKFHVTTQERPYTQYLTVGTNDEANPQVKLVVQAKVVAKVTYTPKRLKLFVSNEGSGPPEITLTARDGQPYAVSSVRATSGAITFDYDSSTKATTHTIQPKVDTTKLRNRLNGFITVKLTHPDCKQLSIPFDVLAKFKVEPSVILLHNVSPEEANQKTIWLLNNYGEDFEVESVFSEKDLIKVLTREKVGKRYKYVVEITPPAHTGKRMFTDVFHIKIRDGEDLKINCNGFYSMNK